MQPLLKKNPGSAPETCKAGVNDDLSAASKEKEYSTVERECVPLTAHRQPELFHVCFGPFALILLVLIRDSNMRHVFQGTQKEP